MGLFKKLFKKKNEDEIPPSTWLPTPRPVTDYDRHTPKQELFTITQNKSDLNNLTKPKKEPDLTHLDEDGELPIGWLYANREFIEKIQEQNSYFIEAYCTACKSSDVIKNYGALKSLVLFYRDMKKLCQSKGECFEKWFSDIIANEDLVNRRTEELKYLEDNIDKLLEIEKLKKLVRGDIISFVTDKDGILQADIYKSYPEELKEYVREQIYTLCHDGIITREKSGRTYALHLVESKSLPH